MKHKSTAAALSFMLLGCAPQIQSAAAPPALPRGEPTEQPIRLETPTGVIHGTLLLPDAASPVPVALLIAGSGPTNRDGNTAGLSGANNSLKLLAEGLAARGIASVRLTSGGLVKVLPPG